ncbi:hypothetical protein [Phaeovulum sp. NW3]|uniref:hypothetical protein n=1 Tax=Phaeovulum sp. NW3 TaxID=2934933 RepID=UPI00201FD0FF|nr:hypothetical protein [Phaeovulum sp. NW3]MCL7464852.1 hypothetical protein [Phaeovulum sp. NW3]
MTRAPVAWGVLVLIGAVVLADLAGSAPLNPYKAPPALALGSGQAASGAHCAAPPK